MSARPLYLSAAFKQWSKGAMLATKNNCKLKSYLMKFLPSESFPNDFFVGLWKFKLCLNAAERGNEWGSLSKLICMLLFIQQHTYFTCGMHIHSPSRKHFQNKDALTD